MGTKRTLVLVMLLATGAVLASGTASAVDTPARTGHFLGALAPRGGQGPNGPGGNLTWHGGPVMHSTNVYSIYWAPSGYGYQAGYGTAIDKYFRDVATDSGKLSNVYAVDSQYADGTGPALYASSFTSSLTDTNPYPANSCTDAPYTSVCLTDDQLQAELRSFIAANGLPTGMSTAYFVFFPIDVGSCFDSTSSQCTYKQYCAYHGWIGGGGAQRDDHRPARECLVRRERRRERRQVRLDVRPAARNAVIPPPTITSFSPSKGRAGTLITLGGQNFLGASKVQLRGVTATFTIVSATRITARVPSGVQGLAKWTVTTPGGTDTSNWFCAC